MSQPDGPAIRTSRKKAVAAAAPRNKRKVARRKPRRAVPAPLRPAEADCDFGIALCLVPALRRRFDA
jgi:hypothetical protein